MLSSANRAQDVVSRFEAVAQKYPSHVAIQDCLGTTTYSHLASRANYVANTLVEMGIERGDRVAIVSEGSAGFLGLALGILKSGAIYVPIDPRYPKSTKKQMLICADPTMVLADSSCAEGSSCTDLAVTRIGDGTSTNCVVRRSPHLDSVACLLYTSGSTGKPKGVMVLHRGLANLCEAAARQFRLSCADRFLAIASPAFSASLEEIFPVLTAGSCLVFATDLKYPVRVANLLQVVERQNITLLELQTALWQQLVVELAPQGLNLPPSLRLIVMGGEQHLPSVASEWRNLASIPLVHVYGPTESTATVTYNEVLPGESPQGGVLPIGRPIEGTVCVLLDDALNAVEKGTVGELFVGGVGLAGGYFRDPVATADRFISWASPEGQSRIYRTGDLVKELHDGMYEFIGRREPDRVLDLTSVERRLMTHPAVAGTVVLSQKDYWGHLQIVAYVRRSDPGVGIDELIRHVARNLEEKLIPRAIVLLDDFPRQFSGKIDREVLRAMAPDRSWDGEQSG